MSSSASNRMVPAKWTSSSCERRVAWVDVEVAVLRVGGRVRGGELEPLDRLCDEAVELGGADASGDGSDLRVDKAGGVDGSARGWCGS